MVLAVIRVRFRMFVLESLIGLEVRNGTHDREASLVQAGRDMEHEDVAEQSPFAFAVFKETFIGQDLEIAVILETHGPGDIVFVHGIPFSNQLGFINLARLETFGLALGLFTGHGRHRVFIGHFQGPEATSTLLHELGHQEEPIALDIIEANVPVFGGNRFGIGDNLLQQIRTVIEREGTGRIATRAYQALACKGIPASERLGLDLDLFRGHIERIFLEDAEQLAAKLALDYLKE